MVADKKSKRPFDPLGKVGAYFFEKGHEHGLIVRCVQDSACLCPPLIISEEQVDDLLARFGRTLDDTLVFAKTAFS